MSVRSFWEEWRFFILFVAVMFVFRSAVADWNQVPSGSMKPNILEGDRIVVNKLAYGLRVPFTLIPITKWADPERFDIVTFPSPLDERLFIKRVIGLPGDVIEIRDNRLSINGTAAVYEDLGADEVQRQPIEFPQRFNFVREHIDGISHVMMLHKGQHNSYQSFGPVTVPAGHYFMLGDNRDDSGDSRKIGFVDRGRILGQATGIAFSLDYEQYYLPRADRFFADLN